jgi:signal transduction histidine kinase
MNLIGITSILAFIANCGITVFLFIKGRDKLSNILLSCVAVCLTIFNLAVYKFSGILFENYKLALFWWQISYTGAIFITIFYAHFVIKFLNINWKKLIIVSYLLGFIFLFFNWFDSSRLFLGDLKFVFNKFYWHDWIKNKNFIFIIFYISFYWVLLGSSFVLLMKGYKKSKEVIKNQLKYIILASAIGWTGAEVTYFSDFGLDIYFAPVLANIFFTIYPFVIAYAIVKYRLMDIRVAITRTGIFIAVYTVILGLPFVLAGLYKDRLVSIFSQNWWMAPLVLMALLATVGPFIYIYVERKAEDRLLAEQRRYQNTLKQASAGMTRIRNLRKLLNVITHIVTKTVRISYAAIYLHNQETDEYVLAVSRDKGRMSIPKLTSDNPLIKWVMLKKEPLIYEEVKRQMQDSGDQAYMQVEENMRILTASVIIPSFLEDKFMGFIVLGDKLSGQIYTPDDLSVFQVLASQAALAIENAQFYEEAKEMQVQIAQAEKMATIGTMADGLSHQINNRFHALSLIAGDTIDTIKLTDTANCTSEVREMINQVNHALTRIQANVTQGGEVVKGMLKYSRKGEEGLEAIDLNMLLDNTIEMVQFKVKVSEIDIIRNFDHNTPKMKGNMVQLEEAFFNFIDNAYDAIVERRTTLKEEGYRGRITVSAKPKDDKLEIIVEDNGMGIKDDNTKKVFTPFFTTKISARKGTGLGLYVINKIITDTHQGKIYFESKHGVGTRFILELPIAA